MGEAVRASALHRERVAWPTGRLVGHMQYITQNMTLWPVPAACSFSFTVIVLVKQSVSSALPSKRYKNNVAIDPLANPGKYKVDSRYNVHALEINR